MRKLLFFVFLLLFPTVWLTPANAQNQPYPVSGGVTCSGCSTNTLPLYNGSNLVNSPISTNGTVVTITQPIASPTLVTPAIGAATGTSLALGGATLGSNVLAVAGTTSLAPAANADGLDVSGISLTGSAANAGISVAGTWNTSGAPDGILVNMTNTASSTNARLFDAQVGGTSVLSADPLGIIRINGISGGNTLSVAGTNTATGTSTDQSISTAEQFNPGGASLAALRAISSISQITGSAITIAEYTGVYSALMTTSGFTGSVTNGYGFRSHNPSVGGGSMPAFAGFYQDPVTNCNGTATLTCTNIGLKVDAFTAVPAASGTITNEGALIAMPSGVNAGTETAIGLAITGNGPSGGSTNWAIKSTSTADSELTGGLDATPIGATTAAAGTFTNLIATGYGSITGVTLPAQAAGTLGLGGVTGVPTLGANGEGNIFLTAAGGLNLIGEGSTNDLTILNHGGGTAIALASATGSITITNTNPGINMNGNGASSIDWGVGGTGTFTMVLNGSGTKIDFGVATASTWTLNAPTTINSATFKVTTLTAATAIDTVCYTTATGLFTEEPTGTTCTVSDERKKTAMQPISLPHSLWIVEQSTPISYYYKPEARLDDNYHLGFGAQTLAKIAPELVQLDKDGIPEAVKQIELLPVTWAAIKQLALDNQQLRGELSHLRAEIDHGGRL